MNIAIEPFDVDRDEAAVIALLRDSLGWPDDPFFDQMFRWKHLEGPWGPSPAWIARDGDTIVGFRTMMRWQFAGPSGTLRAVRAVDTATAPAAQGRGIFRRLTMHALAELEADGVDFVFNTPNEKSRPGYLKMGWKEVGQLTPHVVLRSPRSLVAMARARAAAEHRPVACDLGVPAGEVDGAWHIPAIGDRVRTDRSASFLRWRYGWDALGYRTLMSSDGGAVFRLRRRGVAVEAVIDDLLVPSRALATSAVRHIARRSGGDYALGLSAAPHGLPGGIPLLGQGPILTWRSVCNSRRMGPSNLALSMGDIELF